MIPIRVSSNNLFSLLKNNRVGKKPLFILSFSPSNCVSILDVIRVYVAILRVSVLSSCTFQSSVVYICSVVVAVSLEPSQSSRVEPHSSVLTRLPFS